MVDDDDAVVAALRTELEKHGLSVESAATAEAAVVLLDENTYCGLVLDLVLGRGNGFDVLQHIARNDLKVPTVVVTGKLPSYVREMLDAEHVKLVFPKPVEPRLLGSVVLGLCGIAR